jgi:hypothetical protein
MERVSMRVAGYERREGLAVAARWRDGAGRRVMMVVGEKGGTCNAGKVGW